MATDAEVLTNAYGAVERLHSWARKGQRAPHKPLLVLLALARTRDGLPRLVEFGEVEGPLRDLLINFGPERQHYHPEYPFWRLQHDRLWEVIDGSDLPRRASNTDPLASALRKHRVRGGLIVDLDRVLRRSPEEIHRLADFTASGHLPEARDAVLSELGFSYTEGSSGVRQRPDGYDAHRSSRL